MDMGFALRGISRKEHLAFITELKAMKKEGKTVDEIEKNIQCKAHELIPSLFQEGHNQRHVLKAVWRVKVFGKQKVQAVMVAG